MEAMLDNGKKKRAKLQTAEMQFLRSVDECVSVFPPKEPFLSHSLR
jgi:hypothetical protein